MKNREASMLRDFFNHFQYTICSIRRGANLLRPPVAEISQEVGFVAPGNRASVLDFSGERAAALGNQLKGSSAVRGA